jgi:hypothetical protein
MPDFLARRPTPKTAAAIESLHRLGVDPERVEVVPVSPLESFKGEVVGQVPHAGAELSLGSKVTLFVSRVSLADRLPHDYLEPLPTAKDEAMVPIEPGQVMEYWERQVTAYAPGRRFVKMIDAALARLGSAIDRIGMGMSAASTDPSFSQHLLRIVGYDDLPITDEEAVYLASRLQRMHRRLGVVEGMRRMLEHLLGLAVRVVSAEGPRWPVPEAAAMKLGDGGARLGQKALGPGFTDPVPTLEARIGPVPLAEFVALDRDPRWHERVKVFLQLLAPASTATRYVLELRRRDRALELGDPLTARLSRTSYLVKS